MPSRIIKSNARGGSVELTNCLSSLLALELLSPSPEVYLISPWISNMSVLDNSFGQFRGVMGDMGKNEIRLAKILLRLAEAGSKVRIIYQPDYDTTEAFLKALGDKPHNIETRSTKTSHEKGFITHHFYLHGSMNFTFSGLHINDESVELKTDPTDVQLALLEADRKWEDLA